MSDQSTPEADASIGEKTERVEEIITQLEDGELSLERAQSLHEEGQRLLQDLEEQLAVGEGTIIDQSK